MKKLIAMLLAVVLVLGLGIKQNVSLGIEYLNTAIMRQNPGAYKNLAYIYKHGIGVPVDSKKSEMYALGEGYKYRMYLNIDISYIQRASNPGL